MDVPMAGAKRGLDDVTEGSENGNKRTSVKSDDGGSAIPSTYVPAKVYPFTLDSFQRAAIDHIDKDESVLVAAHTSAGKTAVAEYAIAKALKNGQRVIYTSPIKALSNQKYRDLQEEFTDVGLMTGDMTINPNATCLIMTTEILRSMLYRGSEVMREVAWVIYDEVHYMRDKERGVVWEESIILLPHKVKFVFLSATIPNAQEFVGWVAKLHHQPCFVVATDYRPVPLQHYLFPAAAQGLFLVVDEKGNFKEDTFQKAMGSLQDQPQDDNKKGKKGSAGAKTQVGSDLFRVVRLIMEKKLDPCIVFSFSKKDCEAYALQMARLDFNDETEKELVGRVFENALESLSQDDRLLPQVLTILPLLKRGIGIHHGGLLPILKEVLEILFQEGLIKCLFATETFSIGINMPAKTVVFTQTRKFDGQDFRWITSGEYIQMSGRAGRRGKDDRGIVIQMIDEKIDPEVAKNMIYGKSDALFSSYHVSYNMVLNMLRVEDADPEILLRSSFHQYQQELHAPELEMKAEELQKEAALIEIQDESLVADYAATQTQFSKTSAEIAATVRQPNHCLPFLEAGRLIQVCFNDTNWGWGVLLSKQKNAGPSSSSFAPGSVLGYSRGDGKKAAADDADFVLDVLMHVEPLNPAIESHQKIMASSEFSRVGGVGPCEEENPSVHEVQVLQISLSVVVGWSAVRLNLPKDMSRDASKKAVQKAIQEVLRRFKADGLPVLNPITDMGIMDENFKVLLSRREELQMRLSGNPFQAAPDHAARLDAFCTRSRLTEEARFCIKQARESQAVAMKDELKRMKKVLRRLGYISPEGVLGTKGRFSCELSTADELVLTDMVFDGVFNELSVDQAVGLLSCFIHKEAQKDGAPPFRADMQASFRQLQTVARAVAKVCIEAKIQIIEEDYVKSFNPGMIDIAVAWSAGAKFAEVCALTDSIFEGSIIRNIRRLEELLRQLASASSAIGNAELKKLFEDGANKIRRGVVFSASLYL